MATVRLPQVTTSVTAPGTTAGGLTVADTSGMCRRCRLSVGVAGGPGWRIEVVRVVSATAIMARLAPTWDNTTVFNKQDLSAIPVGAVVTMEEQWVEDVQPDDLPDTLSYPTK